MSAWLVRLNLAETTHYFQGVVVSGAAADLPEASAVAVRHHSSMVSVGVELHRFHDHGAITM